MVAADAGLDPAREPHPQRAAGAELALEEQHPAQELVQRLVAVARDAARAEVEVVAVALPRLRHHPHHLCRWWIFGWRAST